MFGYQKPPWRKKLLRTAKRISLFLSFISVLTILFDVGYQHLETTEILFSNFYILVLLTSSFLIGLRYILSTEKFPGKVVIFDSFFFVILLAVLLAQVQSIQYFAFFSSRGWVYFATFLFFFREYSTLKIDFNRGTLNPAQLFIGSFLVLIVLGTVLLMMPRATHEPITILDALFTSTSAVSVTGLIVVDTSTRFTLLGQTFIIILIQLGGLGIMTFASYFSYFFRGKSSYENQIMLRDMTNSDKLSEVFAVLKRILMVTFSVEAVGVLLIFLSLDPTHTPSLSGRIFFSIFHSISSFCNAGFSTLQNGLYESEFQFNYFLQLVIAFLFIVGGIGFPILFNLYKYVRYFLRKQYLKFRRPTESTYIPWVLNLNSRIILVTTAILLGVGSIMFYFFEAENTLREHNFFGKVVNSFFGAATPRTAGFNTVDMSALNFSTLMLIFLLMWIGASPSSTGGGIKTSTFAVMILNFLSLAKGKDRIEIFRREIPAISIRRAFGIVALSLMVIGTGVFLISYFDRDKPLISIAFESFSAYSTVGLSLGLTPQLSAASKIVIICTMFIGRVSMLTILIALLRRVENQNYRYPQEEILMN